MSHRYHRLKPTGRLRTSAKIALAVAATTIAGLVVLLIIVFYLSKQEISYADSPMVFESADVLQDTSSVLRGSINQAIMGVEIKTSGTKNAAKLSSITFSANGTSLPFAKNIENARLWFTGNQNNFNTSVQIGQTLPQIPANVFEMTVDKMLNPGKNYFWLTYDIKSDAMSGNATVDAECISMRIGASSFIPNLSSQPGKKKIMSNIPYFSTGLPLLYQTDAWNSKRDGSGNEPKKLEDAKNSFFIQSGHSLTNNKELFLPIVVIEKHAIIKAVKPLKIKSLFVRDGGIYQQEFALQDEKLIENFIMDNGANYIHLNLGKMPGMARNFKPKSNQCFYQYSTITFSENIYWGNVLINSVNAPSVDVSNAFRYVQGDLEIRNTGNNNHLWTEKDDTINIGGSLIISGGNFSASTAAGTSMIINVAQDVIMKSGSFYDSEGKKSNHSVLNIGGDVLLLAGDFNFNRSNDGISEINFGGSKNKTIYWSQKSEQVELGNVNLLPGKELIIKNGKFGEIGENRTFTVEGGARLMCGQFPVSGKGMFKLKENATLGIGSEKGINSLVQEGNILTQNKYFDSRANYIYNTASSPQQTGIFNTSPEKGKVKTLTIKKEKPSDNVLLSQDIEATDQVLITMGQLDKKKNKLIISKLSDSSVPEKRN